MEKIRIYTKKVQETRQIEVKQDLIVPDSKQDIYQIKDQNFYIYLNKAQVGNGKIAISGNVDAQVLYLSSAEENVGLQTTISFDDTIANSTISENMNMKYELKVQKQEIKIVNERKISISLGVELIYEVYGIDEIELLTDFSDIEDVQVNARKETISSLIGVNSNIASIKEEIKIESTDIVLSILKINTNISNQEVKISHNKVLTKADLEAEITYLTKDERIVEAREKFPIMSFIEMENISENAYCLADYQVRDIDISFSQEEENAIVIQMEYEIFCKAFEEKEYNIISDLYSLKYDVDFVKRIIEIKPGEKIEVVQNVSKKENSLSSEDSMIIYSVKKNDSLWDVAKKFKVRQESIIQSNSLEEPYILKPGEKVYIVR